MIKLTDLQKHTLKYSNIPESFIVDFSDIESVLDWLPFGKEDVSNWIDLFPNNPMNENSLILQSDNLQYRSIYRKVSWGILIHLVSINKIKSKTYYLTKAEVIDYWKLYRGNRTEEDIAKVKRGDNWINSSLLILDGVDDWRDSWELSTMESFVVPSLQKGTSFIFLTSNNMDDNFIMKNDGMTIVSTILDYSKIIEVE